MLKLLDNNAFGVYCQQQQPQYLCCVCVFVWRASVLSLVSSILTLTLIACDRFFGIVFALKARLTERRSSTFIIGVWVVSIGISAPLLFYRAQFTRQWLNHTEVRSFFQETGDAVTQTLTAVCGRAAHVARGARRQSHILAIRDLHACTAGCIPTGGSMHGNGFSSRRLRSILACSPEISFGFRSKCELP
jgi:hypothetical protein